MMELDCVAKLKEVGKLAEGQLALVLSSVSHSDQGRIVDLCDFLLNKSKAKPSKTKENNNKTFSNMEMAKEALRKMDKALSAYEENEGLDDWSLDFSVGLDLSELSIQDLLHHHNKLLIAASNCDKIKLLICYEKGRVY